MSSKFSLQALAEASPTGLLCHGTKPRFFRETRERTLAAESQHPRLNVQLPQASSTNDLWGRYIYELSRSLESPAMGFGSGCSHGSCGCSSRPRTSSHWNGLGPCG